MKWLRLLPLLAMLALLMAPFGRMAAAEAMPAAHGMATMAEHCADQPSHEQDRPDSPHKATVDCLMACAAIAVAEGAPPAIMPASAQPAIASALPNFAGRHPEADPPPPRGS